MEKDYTKLAVDIFNKNALLYQVKYMNIDKYHSSLDLFCSILPKTNAQILELACGPGNITKYILTRQPELDIIATDLSSEMIKLAEKNNPSVCVKLLDCRSILELDSKYDAIICGFGLPYVSKEDALKMIIDASISLNPGGLLYLSTMEDKYIKSRHTSSSSNPNESLFMYFHEAEYLVDRMENEGFELVNISRVKYVDNKGENVTDLILIGKKNNSQY